MSRKHLTIHDADEDIEYDVEEISSEVDPSEESTEVEAEESETEAPAEETSAEVCPECGKDPCECHEELAFSKEEVDALKELIALVPDLKKLVTQAAPEEKPEPEAEQESESESKESEEPDKEEDDKEEEFEEEEEDSSCATDSFGSLESSTQIEDDELKSNEAVMAERFRSYYGGK